MPIVSDPREGKEYGRENKSTLRRSLGCLLGLKFQVTRVSRSKRADKDVLHFGLGVSESVLSDWMEKNARISWIKHDRPWELEGELIRKLALPLNLQDNDQHPFAETLSDLRREHFAKARQLINDNSSLLRGECNPLSSIQCGDIHETLYDTR